jgi:hypothetical protein
VITHKSVYFRCNPSWCGINEASRGVKEEASIKHTANPKAPLLKRHMVSGILFTITAVNFVYVINNVHENRLSMLKKEQNFDYKSAIFQ